jgi:hypothetical protein
LLSDVVDLPLSIGNDDVLVCTADKEPEDQESVLDNVSDEKALEVNAASDEEDKVNTCGVVDVDVDAASDEDRVDTCGAIDVDADPATGNDKAIHTYHTTCVYFVFFINDPVLPSTSVNTNESEQALNL